jgi:molecular chaperone HtpG
LTDLLLFASTRSGAENNYLTLAQYVEAMPAEQKEIYFMVGENRAQIENSPYMEYFRRKGYAVLLLTDPIDEPLMQSLPDYHETKFTAIDRGEITDTELPAAEKELRETETKDLLEFIKSTLNTPSPAPDTASTSKDSGAASDTSDAAGDASGAASDTSGAAAATTGAAVKEVRVSTRLKESALCVVGAAGQYGAPMERLLREMGQAVPPREYSVEINPEHPAIVALRQAISGADAAAQAVAAEKIRLLFDGAVIAAGGKVADAGALLRRAADLIAAAK